jgi:foldase protein PrsA
VKRVTKVILSTLAACSLVFALPACNGKGSVAATVNGQDLYEDDVTAYVEQMRSYFGATDDTSWATFLSQYGYDPSSMRETAINALAQEMIIESTAESAGVTVGDEEVDTYIADMRDQLGFTNDDDWSSALTSAGYADEDAYRDVVRTQLIREALYEAEVEKPEATDDEIASAAVSYSGEKASHILVADQATADQIAAAISGAADKDAAFAEQLSNTTDTGDSAIADSDGNLGWTCINTEVYYYSLPNTVTALADMAVGDVTVVEESDGFHVVYCTGRYDAPTDGSTIDVGTIPEELRGAIADAVSESNYQTACSEYLNTLVESADIQINDMPSGLSYDVDMSLATTSATSSTTATTGTSTSGQDVSTTQFYSDDGGTYYIDSNNEKVYINVTDATGSTGSETSAS